jgi:hypothetical protein
MIGEEIIQNGVDDPRQIVRDGRDSTPVVEASWLFRL